MLDLINRKDIKNLVWYGDSRIPFVYWEDIEKLPNADVEIVKTGHWIIPTNLGGRNFDVPHCSVCNGVPAGVDENTKYCPHCGARMYNKGV